MNQFLRKSRFVLLVLALLFTVSLAYGAPAPDFREGNVDRIDHGQRVIIVDDTYYKVSKGVQVHSEFVKQDYFSRVKKGHKIKYLYYTDPLTDEFYIKEIWILKK